MRLSPPIDRAQPFSRLPVRLGTPWHWPHALNQWLDARLTRWAQAADRHWAEQAGKPAPLSRYY